MDVMFDNDHYTKKPLLLHFRFRGDNMQISKITTKKDE